MKTVDNREMQTVAAGEIIDLMVGMRDEDQAKHLMRFFRTGEGDYGHGDRFLGLKNPQTRSVVKLARLRVPFEEIRKLILSPWHEIRLCGFLLLVEEMKSALPRRGRDSLSAAVRRKEIAEFYLQYAEHADNWDLVDLSCPKILGYWLSRPGPDGVLPDCGILYELAESDSLWKQRIAVVSNWMLLREGIYEPCGDICLMLLGHPYDLIHKAVGWMLREMGKRRPELLEDFLSAHCPAMSRTTLRYAIENLPEDRRQYWLHFRPGDSVGGR